MSERREHDEPPRAQVARGKCPPFGAVAHFEAAQPREVLGWDPDGGIVIKDRQRLEATLSVYFRHNRFTSFQRQLNNFGFHKKRRTAGSGDALRRANEREDALRLSNRARVTALPSPDGESAPGLVTLLAHAEESSQ